MRVRVLSPVHVGPQSVIRAGAEVDASVFGPPSSVRYLIECRVLEFAPEPAFAAPDTSDPADATDHAGQPPANQAPAAPRRRPLL